MLLIAELLLAPLCVVLVSLAGRRWGIRVAGLLGGLPVVAGPILLVLTLLHGRDFGADAAAGALLGLLALTTFVVAYGRAAPSVRPAAAVSLGWIGFLIVVAILDRTAPVPLVSLLVVCIGFAVGSLLLPARGAEQPARLIPPWWDLPGRATMALALVIIIAAISAALGPHLSGLLAPFPIITSTLAVFTHAHGGPAQARVLLRSFLIGFYGFAAFCFTLAVTLEPTSTGPAFLLALAAALATQAVVLATSHTARRLMMMLRPRPLN